MLQLKSSDASESLGILFRQFRMPARWMLPLFVIIGAFLLAHTARLDLGPNGYHKWRESDTAMVADNFYLHQMDFFRPQVNLVGNAGDGVVGMELPIYNYTVAAAYRAFGFSHMWPRLLSILAGILGLAGIWLLGCLIFEDRRIAWLAAWVFAWSPLVYFYSYKIQPDVLGLALSIWGVCFFTFWRQRKKFIFGLLSCLCLALAGGIKPTFLSVGLPMLWIYWREPNPWQIWKRPELIVFGLGVLSLPVAWMAHAKHLTATFGESYFYLGEDLGRELSGLLKPDFYQNVLLTWPIELALGIPSFIAAFFALIHKRSRQIIPRLAVVWLCGGAIVLLLAAEHCATPHDYYYMVMLPPLSLIAAVGYFKLLHLKKWSYFALVLLLGMPLFAVKRMQGRFSSSADVLALRSKIRISGGSKPTAKDSTLPTDQSSDHLTLSIDDIPGYLLYATGLRGFHMLPDGDRSYFDLYRHQGAEWVVTRKNILESTPWLAPYIGRQILEEGEIVLFELKKIRNRPL